MNEYLNKLIEQYKQAFGIKEIDVNSEEFMKNFNIWLKRRQIMGDEYALFLTSLMAFPDIDETSVEIGKGIHDSIVLDTNIPMITPYSEGITHLAGITNAYFTVLNGKAVLISNKKENMAINAVNSEYIRRYITHNPYSPSDILNWDILHNNKDNITIGIFGSIYDEDKDIKINQLKSIKNKLISEYKESYETEGDIYFMSIYSNRKRPKVRSRSRKITD